MPCSIRPCRRFPLRRIVTHNAGLFQGRWKYSGLKTGLEQLQREAVNARWGQA